jgi:hypothetical protein
MGGEREKGEGKGKKDLDPKYFRSVESLWGRRGSGRNGCTVFKCS